MRTHTNFLVLVAALLSLMQTTATAYVGLCCGKCGGNMPMNIPGGGIPETHEFRIKTSPMYMRMNGLRDGTDAVEADNILGMPVMMGQPTGLYMAAPTGMDMYMLNIATGYSFSDRFFAGLMLMAKELRMDMRFNGAMQSLTGHEGFTMKTGGVADTMLMTKYRLFADDPLIPTHQASLLFSLSLPTGSINEKNTKHPLDARAREQAPYGMQLGSGTLDPTVGLLYQASRSPLWWGANASYTARVYDNRREYRLGDEARLDLYGMYQVRHDFLLQAQFNASWQGRIKGEMDEAASGESGRVVRGDPGSPYTTPLWDPDHYGGRRLFATLGFQWQPAPLHIVDLSLSLPLAQDLNGPQLETDYRLMLTWYLEIPTRKSIRYRLRGNDSRLGF
ncbi:MAG TPA: hypothetical protein ENJ79_00400 [Gammaproteobacteria bacterium]|nr:hypothetical protein [Gammaproteobacteria bacterium]